jgi:signal transduction histidine kinase/CheY-like chemotaxis protein
VTTRDAALFRQFTRWVFWLCLIFGLAMLAAGVRLRDPRLTIMAVILMGHATVTCTLVARARVRSLERAGLIMATATLFSILAFAFVAPSFGPALIVSTLVPAALALQHGRRQSAQMALISLCWLAAVIIGLLGEAHASEFATATLLDRAFRMSGIAMISAIMLLLLWHAARRTWDQATESDRHEQAAMVAEARARDVQTRLEQADEERARLSLELRDAQQLAVLGRLVSGVAHDFNNHLTSLVGYTELLLWELTDDDARRQDLLEIRRAAERATLVTQQLLAFSHASPARPVIVNVADIIMGSVRVLRRVLGADIRLVTTIGRDPGLVRADPTLLGYVLLNIGAHAREAMPHGGTLTVETTNLDVDASAAPLPSSYVRVTITMSRCSDRPTSVLPAAKPFGSASIEDIIREAGGSVITSDAGAAGSTIMIYLPRVLELESAAIVESTAPRGTETVLVVEGESVVRDYLRTLLERHGYRALVADKPRDALALARGSTPPVDLAIANLVVQDEGTNDLAIALAAARPGIRMLYMTHHIAATRYAVQHLARPGFVLEKPFKPSELLLAVRQALDSVPAETALSIER